MKFGYARVSTIEQNLDMQTRALKEAGADEIFTDKGVSGSAVLKEEWLKLKKMLRPGDEVIVWRLDRLSRSLRDLIDELEKLAQAGVSFRSIHDNIETGSAAGKLFFHIVGAFAEFERNIICDRTIEGIAAARAAGKHIGRPPAVKDEQWIEARKRMNDGSMSPVEAARLLGISRQAVHNRLKREAQASAVEDAA